MRLIILLVFFIQLYPARGMDGNQLSAFALKKSSFQEDRGHLRPTHIADIPDKLVYVKIDQGFSYSRLLDQGMSNLHYAGPGAMLSVARFVDADSYFSEWVFARGGLHFSLPQHEGTLVYNSSFGMSYAHLRKLRSRGVFDYAAGGQLNVFAHMRLAPALSNSYLHVDMIGSIMPRFDASTTIFLFEREWHFDFTFSLGLLGYAWRIPEYGATFQIGTDGSETLTNNEVMTLHPGNYAHLVTGVFYKNGFGGRQNPNRYRIGYVWDYHAIKGSHGLNKYNAMHQLVLELFFRVN